MPPKTKRGKRDTGGGRTSARLSKLRGEAEDDSPSLEDANGPPAEEDDVQPKGRGSKAARSGPSPQKLEGRGVNYASRNDKEMAETASVGSVADLSLSSTAAEEMKEGEDADAGKKTAESDEDSSAVDSMTGQVTALRKQNLADKLAAAETAQEGGGSKKPAPILKSGLKARNTSWTAKPKTPFMTPAVRSGGGASSGRRTSGASFATNTTFKQKKAGAEVPRKRAKEREAAEEDAPHVHQHEFIARVTMRMPCAASVQKQALMIMVEGLKTLQKRDETVCYVRPSDKALAIDLGSMPDNWTDYMDEWSSWEDPKKQWKNTIRPGKTRMVKGSVVLRCDMEPKKLMEKVELDLADGLGGVLLGGGSGASIEYAYKDSQILNTTLNCTLFGAANNMDRKYVKGRLEILMRQAQIALTTRHTSRFPKGRFGVDLPFFEIRRDFVKNTPWVDRDPDDNSVPGWSKMALCLECAAEHEFLFDAFMTWLKKTGALRKEFGEWAWYDLNPGPDADSAAQQNLGVMVERHSAVQQCLGKVALRGMVDPDREFEFVLQDDEDGFARPPIRRSFRQILANYRGAGGIKLWQGVAKDWQGAWTGYFTNGKGCEQHKKLAMSFATAPAAHVRFYLLGRGVEAESVNLALEKAFSTAACDEAAKARIKNGVVVTRSQADFDDFMGKMERSSWLDVDKGLNRKQREAKAAEEAESKLAEEMRAARNRDPDGAVAADSRLGPSDRAAYNFAEDISVTTAKATSGDAGSVFTRMDEASLGRTMYSPPAEDEETNASLESKEDDFFQDKDSLDGEGAGGGAFQLDNLAMVAQDEERRQPAAAAKTTGEDVIDLLSAEGDKAPAAAPSGGANTAAPGSTLALLSAEERAELEKEVKANMLRSMQLQRAEGSKGGEETEENRQSKDDEPFTCAKNYQLDGFLAANPGAGPADMIAFLQQQMASMEAGAEHPAESTADEANQLQRQPEQPSSANARQPTVEAGRLPAQGGDAEAPNGETAAAAKEDGPDSVSGHSVE